MRISDWSSDVCSSDLTGRNFAAGMSGGVAYVYDDDGLFRQRCNMAMVDVEAIRPDADDDDGHRPQQRSLNVDDCGMGNVLRHDAERLRVLLEPLRRVTCRGRVCP